jgi:O-antigen/teichoic acid export membrane protein
LVPVSILLFVVYSTEIKILAVFIALSLSYILSLIYLYVAKPKFSFVRPLNTKEKEETKKLIIPLTATVISGMFFGYIDTIVLGRFVDSTYIGYYSAAMALAGSVGSIIGFSSAIFPIFSRLSGERLRLGLKKAIAVSLPISVLALIGTILLSKYVILIVYGKSFLPAVPVLLALSAILIIDPLIAIYTNYHIVIKNQFFIAKTLLFTTVLNIILNVVFIYFAVKYFSPEVALIAASIAIILARGIYLLQLIFKNKQKTNFS